MTAKNLSICFGPNLLYCRVETADTVIGDAIHVTDLTAMLIENPEFFFKKILCIVNDLEDDVDDVISLQEINTLTPEQLKLRETQIEQKRIEKRKENLQKIEEQKKIDEETKRQRLERKKQINQQWEQKIESTINLKTEEKTQEELEKERLARLEKKKKQLNEQWIGEANTNSVDWYRSMEERERAKKRQIRLREEREVKERLLLEEQQNLKKEMEENFIKKVKTRQQAQQAQKEDLIESSGMTQEEFSTMQNKKVTLIKSGQYSYDQLMEWNRELEKYMEKRRSKKVKEDKNKQRNSTLMTLKASFYGSEDHRSSTNLPSSVSAVSFPTFSSPSSPSSSSSSYATSPASLLSSDRGTWRKTNQVPQTK